VLQVKIGIGIFLNTVPAVEFCICTKISCSLHLFCCTGNYLEQLTAIVTLELLSGLFFPRLSAAIGVVYIIGRIVFTLGFKSKSGVSKRGTGFLICILSQISLFAITVYSGLKMAGVF
jgi:glutathione S-transferase